ncbi:MAG: hypothetical protein GY861_08290 [bacterium]|nr:hypothetical protein [bacterium]
MAKADIANKVLKKIIETTDPAARNDIVELWKTVIDTSREYRDGEE